MVPVSYIVTAIVSAAFGSVTTIFMLSITAAAKKADEEEDKLFCEYLKGKKMEYRKRQRSKNGRCLCAISRKQIKYMTLIGICAMTICTKRRELFFCNLLQQADDFFVLTHKNEILFNLCA